MTAEESEKWEVIAIDWDHPNVIAEFEGPDAEQRARKHADELDGLALRAIARRAE